MASLLRFGNYFSRYILHLQRLNQVPLAATLAPRCACLNHVFDKELSRTLATQAPNRSRYTNKTRPQNSQLTLDEVLKRLDTAVRRSGRLTLKEFHEVFDVLKSRGNALPVQALLMLRCCGALMVEEFPERRNELVAEVLDTFKNQQIRFDVSHYNALLQVYLENEFKFKTDEFLNEMEKNGVTPNRVTYQRFIEYSCQSGDIEGARKILEQMKEKGLPINEKVFNALIMGHGRARDMASATGILNTMKNMELEPSVDTYATLLCAYAENGDIESIQKVFANISDKDMKLFNMDYFNIIYSLARSGHTKHVPSILDKLKTTSFGFVNEAIVTIQKLLSIHDHKTAFVVLKQIDPLIKPSGEVWPVGTFFIRRLVRSNVDSQTIIDYAQQMKELNIHPLALQKAAEHAYMHSSFDHFKAFMDILKNEGFPIRPHYFAPFIVSCKNDNTTDKIYDIVRMMREYESPASYTFLTDYVYPTLLDNNDVIVITDIVEKLKAIGYTVNETVGPLVEYFIENRNLIEAAALMDQYHFKIRPKSMYIPLASAYVDTGDVASTIKLLDLLNQSAQLEIGRLAKMDWNGLFVIRCFQFGGKYHDRIEEILRALLQNNMMISNDSYDTVIARSGSSVSPKIEQLLKQLATSASASLSEDVLDEAAGHPRDMQIEELENHLLELRNKGMNTRTVLRQLLILQCRLQNFERVFEIRTELDKDGFVYSPAMFAQLLNLYSLQGNLEEARKCYNELQNHKDFRLDDFKILNFVSLLLKNDQIDEAITMLKEWNPKRKTNEDDFLEGNIWRILNACAEKGDVKLTEELFNMIKDKNCCKISSVTLGPIMKVYIDMDVNQAINKFEEIVQTYKVTPMKHELIVKLMELQDQERLQKVIDLSNEVHGELNTLHDLAFTFIESGRSADAHKILMTPGLRGLQARLESRCERYLKNDQLHELEELVKATVDLFDIDRDKLYLYLLRAYRKKGDSKKALEVWTTMQEENLSPSNATLIYLAKLLTDCNEPVPFAVPDEKFVMSSSASSQIRRSVDAAQTQIGNEDKKSPTLLRVIELSTQIDSLVQNGNLKEALKLSNNLLDENKFPTFRVFRYLLQEVARNGDVEAIEALEPKLDKFLKKAIRFNKVRFLAHIHRGTPEVILQELETEKPSEGCPFGAFPVLLEHFPGYLERVEKLAQEYYKHGFHGLKNSIWTYHFKNENYEVADKVFRETPHFVTSLSFGGILRQADLTQNIAMLDKLLAVLKQTQLPPKTCGKVYADKMKIQISLNNANGALKTFETAKAEGVDEMISADVIFKLKQSLERQGQHLPTPLEPKVSASAVPEGSDSDVDEVDVSSKQ